MDKMIEGSKNIATETVNERFEKVSTDLFYYLELGLVIPYDIVQYFKLLQLYNKDYGYAFPTIYKLEVMLNTSRNTILRSNKRLVNAGLLEIKRAKHGNNTYLPKQPLPKETLYKQVPSNVEEFEKRKAEIENKAFADGSRLNIYNIKKDL